MARTKATLPRPRKGGKYVGGKEVLLAAKAARTAPKPKKAARRARPGLKALREIRKYQKTTELLLPKKSFQRLVREIMQDIGKGDMRFKAAALDALQEITENVIITELDLSNRQAIHAKRVTLQTKDMGMVQTIRKGLLGYAKPGQHAS